MTVLVVAPLVALAKQENLLLWSGVLVGVLLLGAFVISRLDRWRKRQMEGADDPDPVMCSVAVMPAASWPGTAQIAV